MANDAPRDASQDAPKDASQNTSKDIKDAGPPKPGLFESFWPPGRRAASEAGPPPAAASGPAALNRPSVASALTKPAVIKSGTVDGMAYTLYADGSIEADLPEGRAHFDSLDDLRTRLDGKA